jgi:hypothetical protein
MKNLQKREFNDHEKFPKERVQRSPAGVSFPEVSPVLLAIIRLLSKLRSLQAHSMEKRIGEGYSSVVFVILI